MSAHASARSVDGTLRQEVLINGTHRLVTDQPEAAGGEGLGPSPHDLLPAALAACVAWSIVQYGRTKHWELGEVTVDVDYESHFTPRKVEIVVRCSAALSDAQLERLRKVAAACPVRRSLETGFEFSERVEARPQLVLTTRE